MSAKENHSYSLRMFKGKTVYKRFSLLSTKWRKDLNFQQKRKRRKNESWVNTPDTYTKLFVYFLNKHIVEAYVRNLISTWDNRSTGKQHRWKLNNIRTQKLSHEKNCLKEKAILLISTSLVKNTLPPKKKWEKLIVSNSQVWKYQMGMVNNLQNHS